MPDGGSDPGPVVAPTGYRYGTRRGGCGGRGVGRFGNFTVGQGQQGERGGNLKSEFLKTWQAEVQLTGRDLGKGEGQFPTQSGSSEH